MASVTLFSNNSHFACYVVVACIRLKYVYIDKVTEKKTSKVV